MQPYRSPDPTTHPLYVINRLDIEDKHHDLNVVGSGLSSFALHQTGEGGVLELTNWQIGGPHLVAPLVDGAEITSFEIGARSEVDLDNEVTFDVAFAQEGVGKGHPVILTLEQLIEATTEIIDQFNWINGGEPDYIPASFS